MTDTTHTSDATIERELQDKGLTAARVEANIASEHYFTAAQGAFGGGARADEIPGALALLTICVLVLRNGFTVMGESACVSPENFDADVGRRVARRNARDKVWPLMGYALTCSLTSTDG